MTENCSTKIDSAIGAWNAGDVGALLGLFSADVAYCSPLVAQPLSGSKWVQGSQEVADHLLALRRNFDRLELFEVLTGAGFTNLILRHNGGHISMLIEPDEKCQARRIIVCHSNAVLQSRQPGQS